MAVVGGPVCGNCGMLDGHTKECLEGKEIGQARNNVYTKDYEQVNLSNILSDPSNEVFDRYYGICPVCNNKTCELGEYVEYWKVTPDSCWVCGWQEGNGTEMYPDNYDFVNKCWELQVSPYPGYL